MTTTTVLAPKPRPRGPFQGQDRGQELVVGPGQDLCQGRGQGLGLDRVEEVGILIAVGVTGTVITVEVGKDLGQDLGRGPGAKVEVTRQIVDGIVRVT